MRGKQAMGGFPLPKSCSTTRVRRSCNVKGGFENVVLIDVDGDPLRENVIIIDAPESVQEDIKSSRRSTGGGRFPSPNIISIDDDDETGNTHGREIHVECGFDLNTNASSSKSGPAPDFVKKSVCLDDDDDECWVVREKYSPFKFSRCKKTYIGKTPCGKRFGLTPESEDSLSESDHSDCELMEGSGKVREQWEKASLKRKLNTRGQQSGVENQTSSSGFYSYRPSTAEEENRSEQCAETPVFCDSNIKRQSTSSTGTSNENSNGMSPDCGFGSPFVESKKKVDHESCSRFGRTTEAKFSNVFSGPEKVMQDPPPRDRDQDFSHSPLNFDQQPSGLHHGKKGSNEGEKLQPNEPLASNPKLFQEKDDNGGTVFNRSSSLDTQLPKMPVFSGCDGGKLLSTDNCQYDEAQINQSCMEEEETFIGSVSNCKKDEGDILHVIGADTTVFSETDVIIDREKLKQTDQYKRAEEEEWASRQRELQLQAEEAQRLRKRKRADILRLQATERRQKQRLEEMRETKKKDEENMNLKELLRLEVRKELNPLESSCTNMASLLRGLGITVNGGSIDVRAAYKRALLRFHPDRASKTDIRQQVEAEEKFKLISRMKEKFYQLHVTEC